jgi:Uma2 family endonuclease
MEVTGKAMTAEQLLHLPETNGRHELIKGELIAMTPAGFGHGAVVLKIAGPLWQHVESSKLGLVLAAETGFKLESDPDTVRAPDVAFVRRERLPVGSLPAAFWIGAPDLAVEVLSPDDRVFEVEQKIADWLSAGASVVWVVNPKSRTVVVHQADAKARTLTVHDTLDGGDVVPGFRLAVADIFTV